MKIRRRRWTRRALGAIGSLAALGFVWTMLPLPKGMLDHELESGITLLDRSGLPLRTTRDNEGSRARWLSIAEIDPDLLVAFVAAEDRRFYEHHGVDVTALGRAAWNNLHAGRVTSGASTISMQLARLVRQSPRTWLGKATQALWAVRIDRARPKQVILEQYLNRVPLGQGARGVDAAARLYFGTSARELSLGSAALLAGLARNPSRDNPLASRDRSVARRDLVLSRIGRLGTVDSSTVARARLEPILGARSAEHFGAPHFTSWALASMGARAEEASEQVMTSLDRWLQSAVEAEVRRTVADMRQAAVEHAAAVIISNRTGEILAWVGSPDFHESVSGQVDMVISRRQPGSTMKPFLYGLAFDQGYTPATVLPDVATVYRTSTGPYAPRNYDRRFHGPTRMREALGSSYNVPAVELANRVGVAPLLATLHRAGFASLTRRAEHYGLGLALGNGDVTLLELANAYRSLVNGGTWHPVRWTVAQPNEMPGESRSVMTPRAAGQVLDILADPVARIPGFGPATPLELPFRAAVKTGTSRHFTDNWAVAVTASFTVAVWVGNFSGRPMDGVSGVSGAGPLLRRIVLSTASRFDPGSLPEPRDFGLVPVSICQVSGLAAGPHCPGTTEWFEAARVPGHVCDWHSADRVTFPAEYSEWAARAETGNAVPSAGVLRIAADTAPAGFRITSPLNGDRYRFVPGVEAAYATIGLRAAGASGPVRWFVDGKSFAGARLALTMGDHVIRAEAGEQVDEVRIEVR